MLSHAFTSGAVLVSSVSMVLGLVHASSTEPLCPVTSDSNLDT